MTPIGNPMICYRYPLEEALRTMVKLGYRKLELWPLQIEMCSTNDLRRQLVCHAASLGLFLVRLNTADATYFDLLARLGRFDLL